MWLIFHLFNFFARITSDIVTYDVFQAIGCILVLKLKSYCIRYMTFKNPKNQFEGIIKVGWNNNNRALKVNICSFYTQKSCWGLISDLLHPFLRVAIIIDIPGIRVWSKVAKWYWRFSPTFLLKIDLQKTNLHQMDYWKVYFLAYFVKNIQKPTWWVVGTQMYWPKHMEDPVCMERTHSNTHTA